ncbi:hypothetical protein [Zoogloea sp.]|uniref:hypothetical protein n=1 Tax=Zoogloea sp. TaxID=49181 RepID=UPI002607E84B|nr:hypothetical protein [Zoogloea sp.]
MLTAQLIAAVLLALSPRLWRLRQRYDEAALAPITEAPHANPGDESLKLQLAAWLADGAGNGATALPWAHPAAPVPLSCARAPACTASAVRHFGYRLAGYHQLDERSRLGGMAYRIGVQLRPVLWFLPRRADEPWDDAWLADVDETRLAALARWVPRRPTLIVLDNPASGLAARVMAALDHAARHGDHPVRLLILGDDTTKLPLAVRALKPSR